MTYRWLAAYTGFCAYLVVLLQTLSLVTQVSFWPLLLGTVLGLALTARLTLPHPRTWRARLSVPPVLQLFTLPLLLVLPCLLVLLVLQGWHFPPNDWDAMTYHLARAAYWRQWHTLGHFITNSGQAVVFPGNVEALFTALLVLCHSGQQVFLVQIAAYGTSVLAVYGLGRQAGARPAYALLGAGLFATMPEVVLQANSTDVDLTTTSFILCAAYFLLDAVQRGRRASVALLLVALAFAVGAKPTALLALPGLLLGGALLLRQQRGAAPLPRQRLLVRLRAQRGAERTTVLALLGTLLVAAVLVLPWYVENLIDFGAPGGPPQLSSNLVVSSPSPLGLYVNLMRHLIGFLDPIGPVMILHDSSWFSQPFIDLRAWLAAATHATQVVSPIEYPGIGYSSTPLTSFYEPSVWYGLTGALVLYVTIGYLLVAIVRRRVSVAVVLAAGSVSCILLASLLLRWQYSQGRYEFAAPALAAPVFALVAQRAARYAVTDWLLWLLAIYAAIGAPVAAILNVQRPLSAWNQSYNQREAAWLGQLVPVLDATDALVPAHATVGLLVPNTPLNYDWEYPFFGPKLERTVVPIKLPLSTGGTFPGTPAFRYSAPFSYLITHTSDAVVLQFFSSRRTMRCWIIGRVNYQYGWTQAYDFYRCSGA